MMAGYIRSKGQVRNHFKGLTTDHERKRADTVRVRNPIPYNAAYYGHKLHCDQNEKLSILAARNFFHFIQAQSFFNVNLTCAI